MPRCEDMCLSLYCCGTSVAHLAGFLDTQMVGVTPQVTWFFWRRLKPCRDAFGLVLSLIKNLSTSLSSWAVSNGYSRGRPAHSGGAALEGPPPPISPSPPPHPLSSPQPPWLVEGESPPTALGARPTSGDVRPMNVVGRVQTTSSTKALELGRWHDGAHQVGHATTRF